MSFIESSFFEGQLCTEMKNSVVTKSIIQTAEQINQLFLLPSENRTGGFLWKEEDISKEIKRIEDCINSLMSKLLDYNVCFWKSLSIDKLNQLRSYLTQAIRLWVSIDCYLMEINKLYEDSIVKSLQYRMDLMSENISLFYYYDTYLLVEFASFIWIDSEWDKSILQNLLLYYIDNELKQCEKFSYFIRLNMILFFIEFADSLWYDTKLFKSKIPNLIRKAICTTYERNVKYAYSWSDEKFIVQDIISRSKNVLENSHRLWIDISSLEECLKSWKIYD